MIFSLIQNRRLIFRYWSLGKERRQRCRGCGPEVQELRSACRRQFLMARGLRELLQVANSVSPKPRVQSLKGSGNLPCGIEGG